MRDKKLSKAEVEEQIELAKKQLLKKKQEPIKIEAASLYDLRVIGLKSIKLAFDSL